MTNTLKALREQAGLSQREAANLAGVSQGTLIKAEREQDVTLPALRRIAEVYKAQVQIQITQR